MRVYQLEPPSPLNNPQTHTNLNEERPYQLIKIITESRFPFHSSRARSSTVCLPRVEGLESDSEAGPGAVDSTYRFFPDPLG